MIVLRKTQKKGARQCQRKTDILSKRNEKKYGHLRT